jgi:hypothetical protein
MSLALPVAAREPVARNFAPGVIAEAAPKLAEQKLILRLGKSAEKHTSDSKAILQL